MYPRPRGLSKPLLNLDPGTSSDLSSRSSSPGRLDKSPAENSKHQESEHFPKLNPLDTGSELNLRGVQDSYRTISKETDQEIPIFSNTKIRRSHKTCEALASPPARKISDADVSLSISPRATHRTSHELDPREYQIRDDNVRSSGVIGFPTASLGPSNSQACNAQQFTVAPSRIVNDIDDCFLDPNERSRFDD